MNDPYQWLPPLIPTLDVIIDALGGSVDLSKIGDVLLQATINLVEKHRPKGAPKISYIYTSGVWLYGDSRTEVVTDTTPTTRCLPFVQWRHIQEQKTVKSEVVNGIVIRPSLLYGRSGSHLGPFFKSASEGKVIWKGAPGGRLATIHADDIAELYLLASVKGQLVGGQIFAATNDATESVEDLLQKLVQVSGAKGPFEYVKPDNGEYLLWLLRNGICGAHILCSV